MSYLMTSMQKPEDQTPKIQPVSVSMQLFDPVAVLTAGIRVNQAEFARMCGCTRQTVSQWVKLGLITLYPDGKLNPAEASKQILSKKDPRRVKAAIFRDLAKTTDDLRKELNIMANELERLRVKLSDAKESAEFHEDCSEEFQAQTTALVESLVDEWPFLTTLQPSKIEKLLKTWLEITTETGLADAPSFSDLADWEIVD